ncbi:MAG: hypothetical protein JW810_12520 [Sedimentisphaerales bacterium]|nr:hypothetical protein [Sedimentisphaerales bacterium]
MSVQRKHAETKLCIYLLSATLILSSVTYYIVEPATAEKLSIEDGLVENAEAINWLLAALLMFILFFQGKNPWHLLLAIFFVVCLGEEISWGQRLIGFSTPQSITNINIQKEFNLHNLRLFDRRYGDKTWWETMFTLGRLFAMFWLAYGCVLPVLVKASRRAEALVGNIRLPIVPLHIGVFFLLNYVVYKYYKVLHPSVCARFHMADTVNSSTLLVETREWFCSLVFLMFAAWEFWARQGKIQSQTATAQSSGGDGR